MRDTEKLLLNLSQRLALPGDLLTAAPRIEIIGQQELSMEPHEGLLEYSETEIRIKSRIGPICIVGQNMRIRLMNQGRIEIIGALSGVQLPGANDE